MRIKRVAKEAVVNEANVTLAGPLSLSIPPGHVTQTSNCIVSQAVTLFSLAPHMHQLGSHMKITLLSATSGERVILEEDYDFTHQRNYPIEQTALAEGDTIRIECSYMNGTGAVVGWGDSSLDEMCFVGLGTYPGLTGLLPCGN